MKKSGLLLAALAGLALAGCAGRYYDDGYRHGYYHGNPSGDWHDHDRYRDYRDDRYGGDRYDDHY